MTLVRRTGQGSPPAYFASDVFTGILVAVAFAIGLNLTGIEIANQGGEAVVFVVAVLGRSTRPPSDRQSSACPRPRAGREA